MRAVTVCDAEPHLGFRDLRDTILVTHIAFAFVLFAILYSFS